MVEYKKLLFARLCAAIFDVRKHHEADFSPIYLKIDCTFFSNDVCLIKQYNFALRNLMNMRFLAECDGAVLTHVAFLTSFVKLLLLYEL